MAEITGKSDRQPQPARLGGSAARVGALGLALAGAISVAADAAAAPQEEQAFRDWSVKCEGEDGKAKRCFAYQNIVHTKTGKRMLTLSAGYLGPKGEPWIVVTAPLGVLLPSGVALKVDKLKRFDAPFKICTDKGCEAGIPLGKVLLRNMKAGLVARVAFMDGTASRQVTVPVSLLGFSAAFRTLSSPKAKKSASPK